jgi:methylmalonyl-CoA mutase cobalamin-binding subunit
VSSLAAGHLILISELRSALAELGRLDTRLTVVPRDLPEQERAMIGHWRCS